MKRINDLKDYKKKGTKKEQQKREKRESESWLSVDLSAEKKRNEKSK